MINKKVKGHPATKEYSCQVAKRNRRGKVLFVKWTPKEVKNG